MSTDKRNISDEEKRKRQKRASGKEAEKNRLSRKDGFLVFTGPGESYDATETIAQVRDERP